MNLVGGDIIQPVTPACGFLFSAPKCAGWRAEPGPEVPSVITVGLSNQSHL